MRVALLMVAMTLVGLAPRASLAQVRSIADDEEVVTVPSVSAATALAEWEVAITAHVTDADTWSAIGQRLYSTARYRESIAAFEQALVLRNRQSRADARGIADAYDKLGNAKQGARWREMAGGLAVPSHGKVRITV